MAVAPVPTNPLQLTGGAGGSAGPSEAVSHLSNPFASGEMVISYGGNAGAGVTIAPWMYLAVFGLAGFYLWKRSKS